MAAWGLVGADCRPDDVARLGVRIKKLEIEAHDPTEAIADYLEARQMDLVVLATHQRGGLARWMHPPVAEPVVMTTRGPEGFLGALRGSTSSTIIRKCRCPVLAVPRA